MQTENRRRYDLYPLKLWLLSIAVVAPILLGLTASMQQPGYFNTSDGFGVILLFIPFGLVFSLPTFLVSLIVFLILWRKGIPSIWIKVIINVIAIAGVFITFYVMEMAELRNLYGMVYSISIVLCSVFLKIKSRNIKTDQLRHAN